MPTARAGSRWSIVDEDGGTTRTSFDEVAEASRRFANILTADGLVRGDRVAVLSQSLELPVAHLAALRAAVISIPLFALFGEDALEFRLSNSGPRPSSPTRPAGKSRQDPRSPAELKNVYIVGESAPQVQSRSGARSNRPRPSLPPSTPRRMIRH